MLKKIENVTVSPEDARTFATTILNVDKTVYTDPLTGVLNRQYFEDNKTAKLVNAGVVFVDIDNFKKVNDTLGHKFGDVLLRGVGDIFKKFTRSTDRVIRYGGDEFVILMTNVDEQMFKDKLERIRNYFEEANMFKEVHYSLSMGGFIANNITLEKATDIADKLMYEAKKSKNSIVVK